MPKSKSREESVDVAENIPEEQKKSIKEKSKKNEKRLIKNTDSDEDEDEDEEEKKDKKEWPYILLIYITHLYLAG